MGTVIIDLDGIRRECPVVYETKTIIYYEDMDGVVRRIVKSVKR